MFDRESRGGRLSFELLSNPTTEQTSIHRNKTNTATEQASLHSNKTNPTTEQTSIVGFTVPKAGFVGPVSRRRFNIAIYLQDKEAVSSYQPRPLLSRCDLVLECCWLGRGRRAPVTGSADSGDWRWGWLLSREREDH